ncbi:hypothetical protein E5288_WYG008517 [Bos mutus]|uniref:Uncharacterized protein n=1 Tax=Bos mutus TaxID=72004 RepID=A0A6B0RZB7_9CETA|nr:hypothetical protein [Bos mutus]
MAPEVRAEEPAFPVSLEAVVADAAAIGQRRALVEKTLALERHRGLDPVHGETARADVPGFPVSIPRAGASKDQGRLADELADQGRDSGLFSVRDGETWTEDQLIIKQKTLEVGTRPHEGDECEQNKHEGPYEYGQNFKHGTREAQNPGESEL